MPVFIHSCLTHCLGPCIMKVKAMFNFLRPRGFPHSLKLNPLIYSCLLKISESIWGRQFKFLPLLEKLLTLYVLLVCGTTFSMKNTTSCGAHKTVLKMKVQSHTCLYALAVILEDYPGFVVCLFFSRHLFLKVV